MKNKKELSNITIRQLKDIANEAIASKKYEKAMSAISFASDYLYEFNQYYTDDDLEHYTCQISDALKDKWELNPKSGSKKIIVYDGFGINTRGVVLMYLNALGLNNYQVVYITKISAKGEIPAIESMCNKYQFAMYYIDMENYVKWARDLARVFDLENPRAAFFYSTPNDVAGCAVFHMYEGFVDRYLIDLTDHAFWLGKCAADFFLGSRNMSAYLQHYQRNIPKKQMIKLGVNLLVEECVDHANLPFDVLKERYIFSGGALYKTLGDASNTYYRIVNHILENHVDIKFLYAGVGDDSELETIIERFPNRAFRIDERKDFYYLIEHSVFYLNTYPMFGGMMMKYSALAHRLPITLRHGDDSDGLLINQSSCRIEYDTYEELVCDVDRLLNDDNYLKEREQLLEGSVISEERFVNNLKGVIEEHKTDYEHDYIQINTSKFREEYYHRFDYKEQMLRMVQKRNHTLITSFPILFAKGIFIKILRKIKRS